MCACPIKFQILPAALVLSVASASAASTHQPRPRIIIPWDAVPALRHACGNGPPMRAGTAGKFGARAAEFNSLRTHVAACVPEYAMPGDTAAAGFLLLMHPADPAAAQWRRLVETQLKRPILLTTDLLELILALDWGWNEIDPQVRVDFIRSARKAVQPLVPADSPLDHLVFRRKLAGLALAAAVDETEHSGQAWQTQRRQLMEASEAYFADTFQTFLRWRGLSPTAPAVAAQEESDTALAIELAENLSGAKLWDLHRKNVGRWLEHYVLAFVSHPALQHQFLHDSATSAALTPCSAWKELMPITAQLIAARTGDPAAASVADRVLADMKDDPAASAWSWVPIVLETAGVARVDSQALPATRNLDGALIFRGNNPRFPTAVWIEACQPYLRGDQHFDAGNFLFTGGGLLTINAGPDVALEATASKGGGQSLGREKRPFDFSQFATATIAHNCLLVWDATHMTRWRGRSYLPRGGQRPISGTCADFTGDLESSDRSTGSLIAYGSDDQLSYAALDLQAAYTDRLTDRVTREYVFLWGSALLVVDRVRTAGSAGVPISVINLPGRPTIDGDDLSDERRTAGSENDAGIWEYKGAGRVDWSDRDGRMQAVMILPEDRIVRLAGGPAARRAVAEGPAADRIYVGGDADSFERLISPAGSKKPRNAWFELGRPTLLGRQFGQSHLWGRMEQRSGPQSRSQVFATLLVAAPLNDPRVATAVVTYAGDRVEIRISYGEETALLSLPDTEGIGGKVRLSGTRTHEWSLPTTVQVDPPLKTIDRKTP